MLFVVVFLVSDYNNSLYIYSVYIQSNNVENKAALHPQQAEGSFSGLG